MANADNKVDVEFQLSGSLRPQNSTEDANKSPMTWCQFFGRIKHLKMLSLLFILVGCTGGQPRKQPRLEWRQSPSAVAIDLHQLEAAVKRGEWPTAKKLLKNIGLNRLSESAKIKYRRLAAQVTLVEEPAIGCQQLIEIAALENPQHEVGMARHLAANCVTKDAPCKVWSTLSPRTGAQLESDVRNGVLHKSTRCYEEYQLSKKLSKFRKEVDLSKEETQRNLLSALRSMKLGELTALRSNVLDTPTLKQLVIAATILEHGAVLSGKQQLEFRKEMPTKGWLGAVLQKTKLSSPVVLCLPLTGRAGVVGQQIVETTKAIVKNDVSLSSLRLRWHDCAYEQWNAAHFERLLNEVQPMFLVSAVGPKNRQQFAKVLEKYPETLHITLRSVANARVVGKRNWTLATPPALYIGSLLSDAIKQMKVKASMPLQLRFDLVTTGTELTVSARHLRDYAKTFGVYMQHDAPLDCSVANRQERKQCDLDSESVWRQLTRRLVQTSEEPLPQVIYLDLPPNQIITFLRYLESTRVALEEEGLSTRRRALIYSRASVLEASDALIEEHTSEEGRRVINLSNQFTRSTGSYGFGLRALTHLDPTNREVAQLNSHCTNRFGTPCNIDSVKILETLRLISKVDEHIEKEGELSDEALKKGFSIAHYTTGLSLGMKSPVLPRLRLLILTKDGFQKP